jgi:hypothetical protein
MTVFDSTPTGDKPRTHLAKRTNGEGQTPDLNAPLPQLGSNPQSKDSLVSKATRSRRSWLRTSFADVAGSGHPLDPADLDALPAIHRVTAKAIADNAAQLHAAGEQDAARHAARVGFTKLETQLPDAWRPPSIERPSDELLDAIQRGGH